MSLLEKLKIALHIVKRKAHGKAHRSEHWANILCAGALFLDGHGVEAMAGGVGFVFGLAAMLIEDEA